jgi:hypothetical protein
MEQCPSWAANRSSATQEISHVLWNPNIYYHIHSAFFFAQNIYN